MVVLIELARKKNRRALATFLALVVPAELVDLHLALDPLQILVGDAGPPKAKNA
jgi:hypothetical protein